MPKIENPTSVTLYVQWVLRPFEKPQMAKQKSANSKWALNQTKELLEANSIDSSDVKIAVQFNGEVLIDINDPNMKVKEGKEFWEEVIESLQKSNNVETVSIHVNNDTSERIASNLADRVPFPWHQGYQGYNKTTLIYHK